MKWGVVVFPGSNCDHDCYHVLNHVLGEDCRFVWHKETELSDLDCVVLPGGFSYGDYLRAGAIARFSPVMTAVAAHAKAGGKVLGICNGFQVLCEVGLLPGALLRNIGLSFLCKDVHLRVDSTGSPFTRTLTEGAVLRMPIAHGEGRYHADPDTLDRLEGEGQVAFRYAGADGEVSDATNPNGSLRGIAGIVSSGRNVLGLMPHPERCAEDVLGNTDGRALFESVLA
jgi:phosphoribosylformylglycinamidine synthase I